MDTRFFLLLASTSFGLIVVGAIIGNVLESKGVLAKESIGPNGVIVGVSIFFVLFCVLVFALVPLFVRAFLTMQIRVGNGEHFLIKWVSAHERAVVYGIWGVFGAGLIMILTLARDDILKQLK